MVDLGGGVHEVPDELDHRRGPAGPPRQLTCPVCVKQKGFVRAGDAWLCECGQLFYGTTPEWWAHRAAREQLHARIEQGRQGLQERPLPTSTNTTTGGRKESTTT